MSKFTLINATNDTVETEKRIKEITESLTSDLSNPLLENLAGLASEFKKVLTKMASKQSVDLKTVAGYMTGAKIVNDPSVRKELISGGDLSKLGIDTNIVDPKSINLIDTNNAVRTGLSTLGWKLGQQTAQKYYSMLQDAQRTGNINNVVGIMKEILARYQAQASPQKQTPSVGIKQKMQQPANTQVPATTAVQPQSAAK